MGVANYPAHMLVVNIGEEEEGQTIFALIYRRSSVTTTVTVTAFDVIESYLNRELKCYLGCL